MGGVEIIHITTTVTWSVGTVGTHVSMLRIRVVCCRLPCLMQDLHGSSFAFVGSRHQFLGQESYWC